MTDGAVYVSVCVRVGVAVVMRVWGYHMMQCNNQNLSPLVRYPIMSRALNQSGRHIFFSMCEVRPGAPSAEVFFFFFWMLPARRVGVVRMLPCCAGLVVAWVLLLVSLTGLLLPVGI